MNPNYILIKEPIYFGTLRLISLFYNINELSSVIYLSQFFLLEFAEILSFLGYLVYLEIIELKFCGLDTNIKRRILNRNDNEKEKAIKELNLIKEGNDEIQRADSLLSNDSSDYYY